MADERETFSVASLLHDAESAARLFARAVSCSLQVPPVDPLLGVRAHRELLLAALANLIQNAFKFTHLHTVLTLKAHRVGEHVLIEVEDRCGGLPSTPSCRSASETSSNLLAPTSAPAAGQPCATRRCRLQGTAP